MPRIVRKAPLRDRLRAYFEPYDFLLWLSEALNVDAYAEWLKAGAMPRGMSLNILFVLARGTARVGGKSGGDDVFGDIDGKSGSGWLSWFVSL